MRLRIPGAKVQLEREQPREEIERMKDGEVERQKRQLVK